ncbi:uncharacterized protein BDZ99DRAFT_381716 [Mytilinidion resinicola]|uniref:N-acetylglucosamine-induced protein 1 n=1 Tax=Mytilinidion resinicola TaxID=574789 RepID=A0A6A6YXF7_9PEZI|nr:uncharacterized protein BDZ99DRAFT_381716 [Mytilinidion resinicola]KAF2813501.1 hypothetical protein BDZ99DRAFT_381716 [Mytilinidion resinicola]
MPSNNAPPPPPEHQAFHLTSIDQEQLSLPDSAFTPHSWSNLRTLIASNRLEELKRRPSSLRAYLAWSASTKKKYGSITNFLLQERLRWTPLSGKDAEGPPRFAVKSTVPFAEAEDYKVLVNDWPYGLKEGVRHIVVWLKHPLEVDGEGELVDEARRAVEGFVEGKFGKRAREAGGDVLWFKNSVGLQSVRGLEHVHVLVRDVPDELVREWVGQL